MTRATIGNCVRLVGILALTLLCSLGPSSPAHATSFVVDSLGDAPDSDTADGICDDGTGNCTLRAAIEQANATPGTDTIAFNIPGLGPHTIQPASPLPTISDPVVVDGYTQPGASPNSNPPGSGTNAVLKIELDGTNAGALTDGLTIVGAGGSTVRGLVINRFSYNGVLGVGFGGIGNLVIQGNFIGTDVTGTADLGNGANGIYLAGANNSTIGGTTPEARNVISGNHYRGVFLGTTGVVVEGNLIGTDAAGTTQLGNSSEGIGLYNSSNNTIGGTTAGAGNVISGSVIGVEIRHSLAVGNIVQGNFIGTNAAGTGPLGNSVGVMIELDASNNTIGGTAAGAGNVISGNDQYGVYIDGSGATGNYIEGNYIGTDVTGTADLGNSKDGVYINYAPSNTIGGTAAGAGNVISGNEWYGVYILNSAATGNQVQGNYIGTDKNGTADLGNSWDGVYISNAPSNTIGGTTEDARNIISGNDEYGVYIYGIDATGNQVQGNYIGTDVTGTADLGNSDHGVSIYGAPGNTIGGTTTGAGNVISGNSSGVYITNSNATQNVVQGNYIGTDVTGAAGLGNSWFGVRISSAPGNTIGGISEGADNVIAYNGSDGVRVDGGTATGNSIRANSIHSNDRKGIDNADDGNTELAPPIIDSVGSASGHTNPKCYPCTVEVFSDSQDEGRIYHGSAATNDDATGTWRFPGAVTGPKITATITDADGNTSEFSAPYSPPVGGIMELPDAQAGAAETKPSQSAPDTLAIAGLAAGSALLLAGGAWYARRRWLR
jgi:titin